MKAPSDLRILTLAVLQHAQKACTSRYIVMTKINQVIHDIMPPYSPGAVYHELKLLEKENMIKIDHYKPIEITPQGLDLLYSNLLESPLPDPLLSRLVKILALLLISDTAKRSIGLHKIQIEMIKNSQLPPINETSTHNKKSATINELSLLSQSMHKAILSFVAQI